MSRIGNRKIIIPEGVNVELVDGIVKVSNNNETLEMALSNLITMEIEGNEITLSKVKDTKEANMMHGTMNANLTNMIKGVKEGYKKGMQKWQVILWTTHHNKYYIHNINYSNSIISTVFSKTDFLLVLYVV